MNLSSNSNSVPLSEVCTLKGGSGFPVKFQGKTSGDLPFIKVSDMNSLGNEKFIINSQNWLDTSDIPVVKPKVIPANSTVFAKVGAALLLNRRRLLSFETAIDNNMMAAIPNERIDHSYLFYFMQTVDMAKLVQEGALPSINQSQVGKIQVPLPSLEEQRRIAGILSTWEKAINAYDRLIAAKKKFFDAVVCGIFRSSTKGDFVTLGDICALKKKGNNLTSPSVLTNSATNGVVLQSDFFEGKITSEKNINRYTIVNVGDFVYNPRVSSNAPCGPIKINDLTQGVVSPLYTVFHITDKERVLPEYLKFYFDSNHWNSYAKSVASSGARHDRMNLSQQNIKGIPVYMPGIPEQKKIISVLSCLSNEISLLSKKRELLSKQKRGLMQQLLA